MFKFKYINLKNEEQKIHLIKRISKLINSSWGEFDDKFIEEHIINSYLLLTISKNKQLVGFASINERDFFKQKYYYFEFLAIKPIYQSKGLAKKLIKKITKKILFKSILNFKLSINLITISPNPRILSLIYKVSKKIYPNPYKPNKKINKKKWYIAQKIIEESNKPNRFIDKNGLVLYDSYKDTPWLIYDYDKVPWNKDERINKFCDKLLNFKDKKGKEFIIIAKISILKLLKI
jgi:hypothetical protein